MKNPFELFRSRADTPAAPTSSAVDPLRGVRAYHRATQHEFHAYARGPHDLDWATQPDPFRRYDGARLIALDHATDSSDPRAANAATEPRYAEVMDTRVAIAPARVDRASIARLFEDSLALSAWKVYGESTWSLRVNPSSGNLHPTEGYLVCDAIEGLCEQPLLAHYAPREHGLEVRAEVPREMWRELAGTLPAQTFFVGLTSIHWREAWKYGERAWRYCALDVGHAIACVALAARALGWRAVVCDDLGHEDLVRLLGVRDPHGAEAEEPDCLIAIVPSASDVASSALPAHVPAAFDALSFAGTPNELSPDHLEWSAIDFVAQATRKPRTQGTYVGEARPAHAPAIAAANTARDTTLASSIFRARRSAVRFDGRTTIERDVFYRMLARTIAGPLAVLPWTPRVHLGLFVHRVVGLEHGLYLLARDPAQRPLLQAAMQRPFTWGKPPECPDDLPLFFLQGGDVRTLAARVSCHQDIASDGAFAAALLTEFEPALERFGAWFYPRAFWECGAVGQALYLEAEAAGVRATGIGCFFDEPTHAVFGLDSLRYRSLYHFTIGGPVEDVRLSTRPAYPAQPTRSRDGS